MSQVRYCSSCGINLYAIKETGYMLKSEIWLKIAKSSDFLCMKCVELKLGRRLQPNDFSSHPINRENMRLKSAYLINRLTIEKV